MYSMVSIISNIALYIWKLKILKVLILGKKL